MRLLEFALVLLVSDVQGLINLEQEWILETLTGSYADCKENCDRRIACSDIFYSRHHMLCILYKKEISLTTKQYPRYVKDESLKYDKDNTTGCEACSFENCRKDFDSFSCVITVCSANIYVSGPTVLGNLNVVGAKKIYQCTENKITLSFEIICLANGSWSNISNTSCQHNKCSLKSLLPNGIWQMIQFNESHFYADVTCDTGYELRMLETAFCDTKTGEWYGLKWICCDIYRDFQYLKIYNAPAYISGNIAQKWANGDNLREDQYGINCGFRNASIVDNWSSYNIEFVLVRIIENDSEVASMTFDGMGSSSINWFSKLRLINSSWNDLNEGTETNIFSIWGNGGNVNTIRWFVAGHVDLEDACNNKVWLALTWDEYPCGNADGYNSPRILYAKNNTISRFNADELGFADKLEVWISPIP